MQPLSWDKNKSFQEPVKRFVLVTILVSVLVLNSLVLVSRGKLVKFHDRKQCSRKRVQPLKNVKVLFFWFSEKRKKRKKT